MSGRRTATCRSWVCYVLGAALERIVAVVAEHFGYYQRWSLGSRSDDAGRAMAAYLARRRFGYGAAGAIAAALGYRGHSSVSMAAARVESAGPQLQRTAAKLEQRLTNDY